MIKAAHLSDQYGSELTVRVGFLSVSETLHGIEWDEVAEGWYEHWKELLKADDLLVRRLLVLRVSLRNILDFVKSKI